MTQADERAAALAQGNLPLGAAPLRAKWEAFALGKVEGLTNTQAAIKAGFSPATAVTKGSYLNRKVEVRLRVESLRQLVTIATVEKQAESGVGALLSLEEHLKSLAELRDAAKADKSYTAAIAAEIGRGKAVGFHSDRLRPEDLDTLDEKELEEVVKGTTPRRLKIV